VVSARQTEEGGGRKGVIESLLPGQAPEGVEYATAAVLEVVGEEDAEGGSA